VKVYKIVFNFKSPISFMPYELPIFDSIMMWCQYLKFKENKYDFHTPIGHEVNLNLDIPIEKSKYGFYYASELFFDEKIESVDMWKKQWEGRYDNLVNFGNKKARIHIGSGLYKSYNMPIVTFFIKRGWFYFSGDVNAITDLIDKYLFGIGKKNKIGFGWFYDFDIKIADSDEIGNVLSRPLPCEFIKNEIDFSKKVGFSIKKSFGSYRCPYWLPEYQGEIYRICQN